MNSFRIEKKIVRNISSIIRTIFLTLFPFGYSDGRIDLISSCR